MTARRGTAAADPTRTLRSRRAGRVGGTAGAIVVAAPMTPFPPAPDVGARLGRPVATTAERPVVPGQHSLGAIRTRALRALRQRQRASYPAPKAALNLLIVHRPHPRWRVSAADLSFTAIDLDAHSAPRGCKVREGTDAIVWLAAVAPDGPTGPYATATAICPDETAPSRARPRH